MTDMTEKQRRIGMLLLNEAAIAVLITILIIEITNLL